MTPPTKYQNPPPDAGKPVPVEEVTLAGRHDWSASSHAGVDLIPYGRTRTVTLGPSKSHQANDETKLDPKLVAEFTEEWNKYLLASYRERNESRFAARVRMQWREVVQCVATWPMLDNFSGIEEDILRAVLETAGYGLARRWRNSPNSATREYATKWLLENWLHVWDQLDDDDKKWLVTHFCDKARIAEELVQMRRRLEERDLERFRLEGLDRVFYQIEHLARVVSKQTSGNGASSADG